MDSNKTPVNQTNNDSTPSPEDLIGMIVTDSNGNEMIVESIKEIGENQVVYLARDLKSNSIKVMKVDISSFDPATKYKHLLKEAILKINENPDEVIRICDVLLEMNSFDEIAAYDKSIALSIKGDLEKSIEYIDLAIRINPSDVVNQVQKSMLLAKSGQHQMAVSAFLSIFDSDSEGVLSYIQQMGEFPNLMSSAAKLIENSEMGSEAQRALGVLAGGKKQKQDTTNEKVRVEILNIKKNKERLWTSFFPSDQVINLGEEFIASGTFHVYLLGETLAYLNSIGIFDSDCHLGNIIINGWGKMVFVDIEPYKAESSDNWAELAALSLEPLFLSTSSDIFHSILSGYVTKSIYLIDPQHENFTRKLLGLIGGNYESLQFVRSQNTEMKDFLNKIGVEWFVDNNNRLSVQVKKSEALVSTWNEDPILIFCAASYFILSGLPIEVLTTRNTVALSSDANRLNQILLWFTMGTLTENNIEPGSLANYGHQTIIALRVLQQLAKKYKYPTPPENEYSIPPFLQPDYLAYIAYFDIFINAIDDRSHEYFDGLIDFTVSIVSAIKNIRQSNTTNEVFDTLIMDFINGAYHLLKHSPHTIEWDLRQLRRMQIGLSSTDSIENPYKSNVNSPRTLISHFAMIHTQGNFYSNLFRKSAESGQIRWSLITQCLELRIHATELFANFILEQTPENNNFDKINQFFETCINALGSTIQEYYETVFKSKSAEPFHDTVLGGEESMYPKIIRWAGNLREILKNQPLLFEPIFESIKQFKFWLNEQKGVINAPIGISDVHPEGSDQ